MMIADTQDLPAQARAALAHWPELARRAGLRGAPAAVQVLIHRDQPGTRRAVLALRADGQALILKAAAEPWQPDHFDGCLDAMTAAGVATGGGAPRVLARVAGGQAALLERVAGRSLEQMMEAAEGPQDMRRLFRRGAEWLGRFQRATAAAPVAFDPAGMIARHERLRAAVRAGELPVEEPARFLALSDRFGAVAARAAGHEVAQSAAHGDLHPGNILIGEGRAAWAIDFNPSRVIWTGQDIADYALSFALRFVAPNRQPEGGWLPEPERRAFARGHGADPMAGPVAEALILAAALRRWQRIAGREGTGAERLEALMRVAGRACPGLWT
ncbi:phosphotransferase [Frigidibacter sp. MR17.24]|uniref:phosphotransferase n=1 Tax=Frigidibacter sp. MR17.24 TaxID=3127345 RepID=UPI003012BF10